jgi:hypothetical protein
VEGHCGDDVDDDAAQNPDRQFDVALKPKKLRRLPEQRRLVDGETGGTEAKLVDVTFEVVGVERLLETVSGQVEVLLLAGRDGQLHVEGRHLKEPPVANVIKLFRVVSYDFSK